MGFRYRYICAALLACALLFNSCSGGGGGTATLQQAGQASQPGNTPASGQGAGEISPELWQELSEELERTRESSQVPPFEQNSFVTVKDFSVTLTDGGLLFEWSYRNLGDYNQNLETGISDLSVLGQHFGKRTGDPGWEEARLADGDGNGEIGIGDVSPIGQNFGTRVAGYGLYASPDGGQAEVELIAEFDNAELRQAGGEWPRIDYELPGGDANLYYFVVPWREISAGNRQAGLRSETHKPSYAGSQRGDWWKANHDMQNTGLSSLGSPATSHIWWEFELENPGKVQPVYDADGVIYIGDANGLHAISPDGTERWLYPTAQPVAASAAISHGGAVIFGSDDGGLRAVDQERNLLWAFDSGSPVQSDIGIAADGSLLFGNAAGTVFRLSTDGEELWRYDSGSPILDGPALDSRGRIYYRREAGILWLEADGTVIYESQYDTNQIASGLMILDMPPGAIAGEPPVYTDTLYYGPGAVGQLIGLPLAEISFDKWQGNIRTFFQDNTDEKFTGALCAGPNATILFDIYSKENGKRLVRSNFTDSLDFSELPRSALANGISCDSNGNALLSMHPYYGNWPHAELNLSLLSMAADGSENWRLNSKGEATGRPVPYPGNVVLLTTNRGLLAVGGPLSGALPEQVVISSSRGLSYETYLQVDLSWERINGADHYLIHRSAEPQPVAQLEGNRLGTMLNDMPPAGQVLQYTVTAVNGSGQAAASDPIELVWDYPAPQNLVASQGEFNDRIELSWDSVDNAEGYRIWRDGKSSKQFVADIGPATSWTDSSRTDWNQHEYRVSAISEHSEGRWSLATGWQARGTGDSGAANWRSHNGNPANSRLSQASGPVNLDDYQEDLIVLTDEHADRPFREFVLGSGGSIYGGAGAWCMAFDAGNRFRWAYKTLYTPTVVLTDGSLFGVGDNATSVRVASNGELIAVDELEDLRSVNMAENGELLLVRYHSASRMDQAGNIIWDFPFSDVSPAGYMVEGPEGNLYFSTDMRQDPPDPLTGPGNIGVGGLPPPPPRERSIVCLDADGNELWTEPYWSVYRSSIVAGVDGTVWLNANIGFLEGLPDQAANPLALYSVSADGNLQWHSDGSTALDVMGLDNGGRAIVKQDATQLLRVSPAGVIDLDSSVPLAILLQDCLVDNAGRIYLSYAVSYDGNYESRVLALDSAGQQLWSIDEEGWYGINMAMDDAGTLLISSLQDIAPNLPQQFRITRIGGS